MRARTQLRWLRRGQQHRRQDAADPRHPAVVSTVALQTDDRANCTRMMAQGGAISKLAFSSHYCAVDDPSNTTAVACTWMGSGLRVFDVRDPLHVRKIAYYVPPERLLAAQQ